MSMLWEAVRQGRILAEELIIDCHTHMGPWFNFNVPGNPWAEGMIQAMDTCGIQKVICMPHVAIATDYLWGNRIIEEVIEKHPNRFAGYCLGTAEGCVPEHRIDHVVKADGAG